MKIGNRFKIERKIIFFAEEIKNAISQVDFTKAIGLDEFDGNLLKNVKILEQV